MSNFYNRGPDTELKIKIITTENFPSNKFKTTLNLLVKKKKYKFMINTQQILHKRIRVFSVSKRIQKTLS